MNRCDAIVPVEIVIIIYDTPISIYVQSTVNSIDALIERSSPCRLPFVLHALGWYNNHHEPLIPAFFVWCMVIFLALYPYLYVS